MERKIFLLLSLLACLLCACTPRHHSKIELQVENAHKRSVVLFEIDAEKGAVLVDSLRVKKQKVSFVVPTEDLHVYALFTPNAKTPLVLAPLPGESLRLITNYDSLTACARLVHDSLSPVNAAWIAWQKKVLNAEKELEQIEKTWLEKRYELRNTDSLYAACSGQVRNILECMQQDARKYCMENTHNLTPILLVNKNVGRHSLFNFNNAEDLAFLRLCADSILKQYPENSHAQRFQFQTALAQSRLKQETLSSLE